MNQREIKFRAWDKIRNLMITSKHGSVGFGGEIRPQEYNHNEFILMQFTGLKDKNGKEIYEGDIISRIKVNSRDKKLYLTRTDKSGEHIKTVKWLADKNGWNFMKSNMWVVLGNIYQNSNLIK